MQRWLSPLLLALPAALVGELAGWRPLVIFVLAMLALIPLAGAIGHYTEQLGEYFGPVTGGLLDATFGNAPEIIIGVLLLAGIFHVGQAGEIVRALIIGSIASNALFVLGTSIFFGALRNGRMTFSADRAGSYASMLALAVAGLALPAMAAFLGNGEAKLDSQQGQIQLSVVVSIVLLLSYFAYLAATIFHVGDRRRPAAAAPAAGECGETEVEQLVQAGEDDEAAQLRQLREKRRGQGPRIARLFAMLAVATVLTMIASVVVVSVTDTVIVRTALTPFFVGFILFPFITNAVEQLGAITAAYGNQMEEAMAIAAGSSVQMALLVAPVLMLASLALGHPITLIFLKVELVIVTLVTFAYALVSLDGETTWLEGLQLIAFYLMVAATAFFIPGT